jgi:hypothetical protein
MEVSINRANKFSLINCGSLSMASSTACRHFAFPYEGRETEKAQGPHVHSSSAHPTYFTASQPN